MEVQCVPTWKFEATWHASTELYAIMENPTVIMYCLSHFKFPLEVPI